MKTIDEELLRTDPAHRYAYLAEFIGFGDDDVAALHGAAPQLAPLVPGLVDAVYEKLFSFDLTRRPFLVRQAGYEGEVPAALEALTPEHDMVRFRKQHLAAYFEALVTKPYGEKMVRYLDAVGRIHTSHAGNPAIVVEAIHMNALLGFVHDALMAAIFELGLGRDDEVRLQRAVGKLLWIQNDFINRHYQA
ncbi:protoglobin family protein [Haliangium ochraceum]|uniref:Globin-sensor domain-containing protein n=1 Tax=Haliangium ochraceum (strain DSM 14365 / JCM 11303 / SMP-2) TaxID=502025 RepID=D0LWL0_HALO1|nr:protoglobin family protein [Haliangium ochraceum]ACY17660.1 conserved hypothetical protein [Haliangium ochraceum DSM 14365]